MVSMEEEEKENHPAASLTFPRWWDTHNRPRQSQWLQNTMSDLIERTKIMLNIIQDDGESFAKRAEMYYKRRPELIKMVQGLHRSYLLLAEKYDHLRSESIQAPHPRPLSSLNSFKQAQILQDYDKENVDSTKPVVENPDPETETPNFESLSTDPRKNSDVKLVIDGFFNEGGTKKEKGIVFDGNKGCDFALDSSEREKMWNELRLNVSKLIQDNLRQQAELVRRNDEKREAIKDLCSRIKMLTDENKALKSCLAMHKEDVKQNQSQVSRLKGLILGRFSG